MTQSSAVCLPIIPPWHTAVSTPRKDCVLTYSLEIVLCEDFTTGFMENDLIIQLRSIHHH